MIRSTLLSTVGLLVAYSIFIYVFRSSIQRTAQTIEQRNVVKAEEFLYEGGQKADTIIVGSSMSNRLVIDSLRGNYYNLSMEGMASVDGLWLIAHTKHRPRLLLVETNTLDRTPDSSFFAKLEQSGLAQIREYVPFMRLKYQPVGVVKALLRDGYAKPFQEPDESIDTAFVTKVIEERLARTPDIPEEHTLKKAISLAGNYIRALRSKGTQVIFFEMPTDPRVRNTKVYSRLRQIVQEAFPFTEYRFIRYPSENYQSTDGVHLPRTECLRYTHYLYQQLSQNNSSATLTHVNLPVSRQ